MRPLSILSPESSLLPSARFSAAERMADARQPSVIFLKPALPISETQGT
jgi:hypothetical protein